MTMYANANTGEDRTEIFEQCSRMWGTRVIERLEEYSLKLQNNRNRIVKNHNRNNNKKKKQQQQGQQQQQQEDSPQLPADMDVISCIEKMFVTPEQSKKMMTSLKVNAKEFERMKGLLVTEDEGYFGCNLDVLSATWVYDDEAEDVGDANYLVRNGYVSMVNKLAEGLDVKLGHIVTSIESLDASRDKNKLQHKDGAEEGESSSTSSSSHVADSSSGRFGGHQFGSTTPRIVTHITKQDLEDHKTTQSTYGGGASISSSSGFMGMYNVGNTTSASEETTSDGNNKTLYPGKVKVNTTKGDLEADYVVITLPLGVLQAGWIEFNPPLPAWKRNAIHSLGSG